MNLIKKVLFILFLLLSVLYLFIILSPKIFKNFYPFGIRCAIVVTGSMEPTIHINDFIIVKKPDKISVNDIVSYNNKDSNYEVLHRVVERHGNTIVTKGDANNKEDEEINIKDVTGIYPFPLLGSPFNLSINEKIPPLLIISFAKCIDVP